MASQNSTQHIRSRYLFQMWDHDPDTASAIVVTPDGGTTDRYVDMRDYEQFAVLAKNTVLTGAGITKLEIVAASDTAGTDLAVVKDSGTIAPNDLNDWAIEECSAEEVAQLATDNGTNLRYVAGRITVANSADESAVVYFGVARRQYLNLTPATTIS